MSFVVAIDFDGTLMQPTGRRFSNTDMGVPVDGAQMFVSRLMRSGVQCFVHSVRANTPEGKTAITAWLARYKFPPMRVEGKPTAHVYLDDRGLHFGNWSKAYADIIRQKGKEGQ